MNNSSVPGFIKDNTNKGVPTIYNQPPHENYAQTDTNMIGAVAFLIIVGIVIYNSK